MGKSYYAVFGGLLFAWLPTLALAAPPPQVTFNLTGVGSGANLGGVYTSPYSGNINGGATIPVICDDFLDDSYVPESWNAYVTPTSSVVAGTYGTPDPYLNWLTAPGSTITVDGYALNQVQAYTVAAVLAVDIITQAGITTSLGTNAQQDYSYALWGLFDPNAITSSLSGYVNDQSYAQTFLNAAVTEVMTGSNATQVQQDVQATTIYTYKSGINPNGPANCGGCSGPPQEFITVTMAEPYSPALLGLDLLGVAGLTLFVRRRRRATI